jgi:exopolyphosphatase/guanosine-5'-triphosphate,3'-diphosphate pyrophosphatase
VNTSKRRAIIDIGSNSIRLVVYVGPLRAPVPLYNEKLLAGLGRGVSQDGRIDEDAIEKALAELVRFRQLTEVLNVADVRAVATAAVRDASNGAEFLTRARAIGLEIDVLSGDDEAMAAGLGVISALPDADGIAGDLGGGSLELVRVKGGQVHERCSLPLGAFRLGELRAGGDRAFQKAIETHLAPFDWLAKGKGRPFYTVGGSWRSLSRLHMHQTGFALPVLGNHEMPVSAAAEIERSTRKLDKAALKDVPTLSTARLPVLNDAAALLTVLGGQLRPSLIVTCAFGLREGLLYKQLTPDQRAEDPLLSGVRFEGDRLGRTPGYGDALHRWLSQLFADDPPSLARLRHAACLLADIAWSANPEFRAERGFEAALHGNWSGVTNADRAILTMAVYTSLGGGQPVPEILPMLAESGHLQRARQWGLAIRVAQRLTAGAAVAFDASSLSREGDIVRLTLSGAMTRLAGESVDRRLKQLATALGCKPEVVLI